MSRRAIKFWALGAAATAGAALGFHALLQEPAPRPATASRRAKRRPPTRAAKAGAEARPTPAAGPTSGPMALEIRCLDAAGLPLGGVMIDARRPSGAPLEPAVTDVSGEARIPGLPPQEGVSGEARHPAYAAVRFGPARADQGPLTIRLDEAASEVGTVILHLQDDRGQPLRDFELAVQRGDGLAIMPDVTLPTRGPNERRAELPAGAVRISARGPRYAESPVVALEVPAGGQLGPIRIIAPRKAQLTLDPSRPADLDADAALELVLEKTDEERRPVTRRLLRSESRRNAIWIDPGAYQARLVASDTPGREGPWLDLELAPGQQRRIRLELPEMAVSISGVIRDDRGRPLAEAQVAVGPKTATTDAQGRYVLKGLRPGQAQVSASKAGHIPASSQRSFNGAELIVELELSRAARVEGRLMSQGRPRPGTPIFLIPTRADWRLKPRRVESDAAGRFAAELPPGLYRIKTGRAADPFQSEGGAAIELEPGQTLVLGELQIP